MEITEEELTIFADKLKKLNNEVENALYYLGDRTNALRGMLVKIEEMLGVLAKIAQQAEAGPSLPPPGRP